MPMKLKPGRIGATSSREDAAHARASTESTSTIDSTTRPRDAATTNFSRARAMRTVRELMTPSSRYAMIRALAIFTRARD